MTQPTQPKKFKTILADVPYMKNQTGSYGACKHYNLMSHEEIRNMPIKDIAADNAHLWFWTSNSYMEESYDIIRAWGFEPKKHFYLGQANARPGNLPTKFHRACRFRYSWKSSYQV